MEGSGTSEPERVGSAGGLLGQGLLESLDFLSQAFEDRGTFREPFFAAEQLELLRFGSGGSGRDVEQRALHRMRCAAHQLRIALVDRAANLLQHPGAFLEKHL